MKMLDEYTCDLCGCLFFPVDVNNLFCPSCGSSHVQKEMGSNELSDEDVYVDILDRKERTTVIF